MWTVNDTNNNPNSLMIYQLNYYLKYSGLRVVTSPEWYTENGCAVAWTLVIGTFS